MMPSLSNPFYESNKNQLLASNKPQDMVCAPYHVPLVWGATMLCDYEVSSNAVHLFVVFWLMQ